jgi:hypothetical protein
MKYTSCLLLFLGISFARAEFLDDVSSSSSEESPSENHPSNNFISRRGFSLCGLRDFRVSKEAEELSGQPLVDYVNSHQNLWRANLNSKFERMDKSVIQGMMGVHLSYHFCC